MTEQPNKIEYRLRPVTRYVITRYEETHLGEERSSAACGTRGEYDNADTAYEVGYALAKADHERMGWPLDSDRIKYPRHPELLNLTPDEVYEYRAAGI